MLLQTLCSDPQHFSSALLNIPCSLLGAVQGAANAIAVEAREATAAALDEGHTLLQELLGTDAVREHVLRPLLRLERLLGAVWTHGILEVLFLKFCFCYHKQV